MNALSIALARSPLGCLESAFMGSADLCMYNAFLSLAKKVRREYNGPLVRKVEVI